MFISSEPRHPGRSVLPTVWLTWGGFGGGQSSRFPLGDCSSAPPSCALASLLQKEILLPHPQDWDWVIPGSNKPLSAVAGVPLPNPQPVHVYLMAPSGSAGGGGQRANE